MHHGADPGHRDSVAVRTLYAQAFAFPAGDIDRRAIGAGTALRTTLRMLFAYHGAFLWKMNAGMGDIVFTPFYRVLKRRGVRFEFFSRVRGLHLSADKRRVERITVGRQLRVKDPRVGERLCWPTGPDLRQIDNRQARRSLCSRQGWKVDITPEAGRWAPPPPPAAPHSPARAATGKWPDCVDDVPYDFKAECEKVRVVPIHEFRF